MNSSLVAFIEGCCSSLSFTENCYARAWRRVFVFEHIMRDVWLAWSAASVDQWEPTRGISIDADSAGSTEKKVLITMTAMVR